MYLTEALTALSSDPQQMTRGILRIFHFIGLALGLGSALLLDMMIVRFFLGKVLTQHATDVFAFCAEVVGVGLKLLWVTGIGFLIYYWLYEPIKLTNEKVWAKMVIVAILTVNGHFIHKTILPFLQEQVGRTMLEGTTRLRQHLFVSASIVSLVSWFGPLIIANLPQLNFQVPMLQILAIYAMVLAAFFTVAHLILMMGNTHASLARKFRRTGAI
ncbi:hypothetical protein [Yoonia sp. 2307UL14-13]|uniref:hypothetical protein n=1 Tax=Yoonia sp. 2307UL14-13 TaxID=3126506 RepID=UPI00309DC56C